jgi:hypothetical protein
MPNCREPYLYLDLLSSIAVRDARSCCMPEKYVYPPSATNAVEPGTWSVKFFSGLERECLGKGQVPRTRQERQSSCLNVFGSSKSANFSSLGLKTMVNKGQGGFAASLAWLE